MADSGSEDDDALPISGLQHLAFCPRQWALIHLEQVWVENMRTAEGRLLHERADLLGESRRANVRTVRGMWLRSERLRLTGRADIVEFRPEPFPVECKGRSFTAIHAVGRKSSLRRSFARALKNSPPRCTACTATGRRRRHSPELTVTVALWSTSAFPRPPRVKTARRAGWRSNCVPYNRRSSSTRHAKAAQYTACDDAGRLFAPRR